MSYVNVVNGDTKSTEACEPALLLDESCLNQLDYSLGGCMSRIKSWDEVIDKMVNQLSKWKMRTLSIEGRLTLLKAVFGSMPIYHMSILSWNKVLTSKEKGGLGVSSLFALNRALMFKWFGDFFNQSDSLWVRVIHAIHGVDGRIGRAGNVGYTSIWCDIIKEMDRMPRSGIKSKQWDHLLDSLEGVMLSPSEDRWSWDLNRSGEFSVASARSPISNSHMPLFLLLSRHSIGLGGEQLGSPKQEQGIWEERQPKVEAITLNCKLDTLVPNNKFLLKFTFRPEARNSLVQAVYAFGDSFADSGNNNNRTSVIKANFPPYGKDFMGGISTGRFTNRKTIADYVVEKLGVKDYLPAYLDPALQDTDLPTGVCFASGGAGVDELTSTILNVWSLQDQLEFFKEYIVKLKRIVGEEEANQIISNALYLYNVPAYSKLLADKAENFIQELYNLGARRMAFFNTPAIACYPLTRTVAGGLLRKCSPKFNEEAHFFDNMVIGRIEQLNNTLPQARFAVADYYTIVNEIIEHADEYGFTVLDKGCCGSGVVEAAVLCNPLSTTCLDDSKYLFWDSVHLTDKGYDIVVDHALPRLMYSVL
nr:hypothetical protein [Tanacetum cinerariifolium]